MASPLVKLLISTVTTGCAAGLTGGLLLAHSNIALNDLLVAEDGAARMAYLVVTMQVGAVVSLIVALAFDQA